MCIVGIEITRTVQPWSIMRLETREAVDGVEITRMVQHQEYKEGR